MAILFVYVGPGAGFTVIGSAVLFLVLLVLVVVGIVWYPIAMLWRALASRAEKSATRPMDDLT